MNASRSIPAALLAVFAFGCSGPSDSRGHSEGDAVPALAADGGFDSGDTAIQRGEGDASHAAADGDMMGSGNGNMMGGADAAMMGGGDGMAGGERRDAGSTAAPDIGAALEARVGDGCGTDADCPGGGSGTAKCLTDWPGGYCAVTACAPHGHDCPEDPGLGGTATSGGKCVLAPAEVCLALCAANVDCRPGYACKPAGDAAGHGTSNVCLPL